MVHGTQDVQLTRRRRFQANDVQAGHGEVLVVSKRQFLTVVSAVIVTMFRTTWCLHSSLRCSASTQTSSSIDVSGGVFGKTISEICLHHTRGRWTCVRGRTRGSAPKSRVRRAAGQNQSLLVTGYCCSRALARRRRIRVDYRSCFMTFSGEPPQPEIGGSVST